MSTFSFRPIDLALRQFLQRQFPAASAAQLDLAAFVSYQLAEGHLCLDGDEFLRSHQLPPALNTLSPQEKLALFDESQNPLINANATRPLVFSQNKVYLNRYFCLEDAIDKAIKQRLQHDFALSPSKLNSALKVLFPDSDGPIDWQKTACAIAGQKGIGIITGGPGTGKTTTVVKLLVLLQQLQTSSAPLTIALAAPTGKAAARLTESIHKAFEQLRQLGIDETLIESLHCQAKTLHQLLGYQRHSRHFRHNQAHPLMADILVLDEASMVDIDMMLALLNALPERCRLILLGDKNQLASVEAGRVLADLCQFASAIHYSPAQRDYLKQCGCLLEPSDAPISSALSQQTVELKKSWRAKDAQGILALADAVNQQDSQRALAILREPAYQHNLACVSRHNAQWLQPLSDHFNQLYQNLFSLDSDEPQAIDHWASSLLEQLSQWQLLSPLRQGSDGVEALNTQIKQQFQQALQHNWHQAKQRFPQAPALTPLYYPGEPLLVTRNLYDLGVMNGDVGLALFHPALGMRVAFSNAQHGGIQWIIPEQLEGHCQGAYAITVHQSQGSEYRHVMLYMPERFSAVLSKELIYTAITRAKTQFILVQSANAKQADTIFCNSIDNQAQRFSGLAQRLHHD